MKSTRRSLAILASMAILPLLALAPSALAQTVTATLPVGANPGSAAVNPVTNRIYVTNQNAGTVTVIDGATNATTTVTVGNTPVGAAVNTVTNKIYIANAGSGNVTVIDGVTNATTTVTAGANPDSTAINPVTNKIYVSNQVSGTVTVIDGATNATTTLTVGAAPLPAVVNPVTNKIYVGNNHGASVSVIDGATNAITTLQVGVGPDGAAINLATNKIYIPNFNDSTVSVIDGASNSVIATIPVGTNPLFVTLNPVTNKIYTGNNGSSNVTVIDGATNATATVALPSAPGGIALNPVTNMIFATNPSTNKVTVIDGATNTTTILTAGTSPGGVAVNPVTDKIYVANATSNNVTVIDGATNPTATVAAGLSPFFAAVNPVTNQIYVANGSGNNVTVIDGATNATTTVTAGSTPFSVAVNPVTNKIYVGNNGSANVTVIDGATNATTTVAAGSNPNSVVVNPVTNKIYVANGSSNNVTVIDGATNATTSVAVGAGPNPNSVAVNPVTNKIYVANSGSNNVTVIDGATNNTATVAAGTNPFGVALNTVTNKIYVANSGSNNVTVIDGATNNTTTVADGNAVAPLAVALNPVTNKIYVANGSSNNVTVIDGATNTTTTVAAGTGPNFVAVNPVTNKIYVADKTSNNVTVIDGATNTTATVANGNGLAPFAVAVNPVTNQIYATNNGSSNVTVITEQQVQPIPLTTTITPLAGNQTSNPAPTFTFTATSTFAPTAPPVVALFYQFDTWQGPWTPAMSTGGGSFTGIAPALSLGTHILYAYATDGQDSTSIMTTIFGGCSPVTGAISAYLFVVNNSPGPATHFSVTAPAAATAGTAFNFTVTAKDAANNTVTTFADTVNFSSTDGAAILPSSDVGLTSGVGNFQATLSTVGPQTITVTDANTASITGTSGNITVTASSSLGVGTTGTSTGTVMGNGIDCATGSNTGCLVNIPVGTTVTLTAAPTNGAMFAGWNAGPTPCTVSGAMCTFQMPTGSETVFATFNAVAGTPLLTVQILGTGVGGATGNGIACFSGDGTGCTIGIAAGTQVTLTEAPNAVSAFAGWGAPCSNTAMTCSFSMPAGGQFVTATFTATPTSTFTLTPNQLFFGPLALNTMSTSQPLAVTNNGAAAVTVNGISFAGNAAADFGQSNTCGTSVSGDGGHCAINVAATPKASGPRTADLSLASSDPASPAISHMTANGTIRQLPGFTTNVFPANDDGSTNAIPLPFSLNFFGATFSSLYVNNNGNVTFGQPLSTFTPTGLNGDNGGIPIIAPFWADVDTTGVGSSLVTYGTDTVNGLSAFGVDFENVGYFSSNSDKLNSFQVILIDRSDTGAGNFDMEFDYDKIQWEAGDASGGTGGLCGAVVPPNCVPAAVGYSNGTGTTGTNFQLGGSFVPGALLDGGPTATSLIVNSLNSATPGRYVFQVRNGAVQTADLSLTMSGKPNPVVAGTNETFTITATNLGPSDATNVTVTDTLPNNATLVSATPSQGAACTGTTTLSCNLGTLTVEALATVTVIVSVNANATGTVTNAASVISDQPDPNPANNSASASATITTAANPPVLSIMKSHAGTFTQGQQGAKYTVTVSNGPNAGPTSGTVTVTETAPAGLTLISMGGTGWTCTVATATCTTTTVLNAGGIYPAITVTVNVLGNATSPQVNQVGVTGGGSAAASTSDSTTIVAATPPILQIKKSHAGNFTQGQQGAKYTVTVSTGDAGSTNGTAVTMTDTVPAGLTLVSMAGAGWTCTVATATCTTSVALSANANYPSITVTVNVTANATSPQVNQVSVSGGGAAAAASASDSTVITPLGPAVLTITKSHAADFTLGQQGAQYTVTVTNGPNAGPTNGVVTVTDAIPDGLSLVSMAGTGWTCTVATATCTTTTVLNSGGIYPAITVTVNVSATSPAQVTNTVTVTGGGSAAANANDLTNINAAPFTLVITPPAGGGTATPPAVSPGGQIAIGLTLTPISGFNGTVTLSCVSSAPQFITCAPAPSTVKILVGGTQVAIVINTFCQGATPANGPTNDPMNGPGGIVGALEVLLAALSLASIAWAYRRRSRWALSFAALMLIAMGSAACNNLPKGPNGRTPPGNYTLFIKATANGQGAMVQVPIQVLP